MRSKLEKTTRTRILCIQSDRRGVPAPLEQPVAVGPFRPLSRLARRGRGLCEVLRLLCMGTSSCPRCGQECGARRRAVRRCPRRTRSLRSASPSEARNASERLRTTVFAEDIVDTLLGPAARALQVLRRLKPLLVVDSLAQLIRSTAQALRMGRLDRIAQAFYSSESRTLIRTVRRGLNGQKECIQR